MGNIINKCGKVGIIVAMALVVFGLSSCGNRSEKIFNNGRLDGDTYYNSYFGFRVDIPKGWYILDRAELEQANAQAADAIPNKTMKEQMARVMEKQSISLLTAYQAEPGSVSDFIPSFQVVAENLKWLPNVKTGEHYLQQALEAFRVSGMQYEDLDVPVMTVKIGGMDFYTIKLRANYGEYVVTQEWYSSVMEGFALNFGFTYDGLKDAQAGDMNRIRRSIRFFLPEK